MEKHSFEIEIKSLLGGKGKADELVAKMRQQDKNLKEIGSHKQLNHYFIDGNLVSLYENVRDLITDEPLRKKLEDLSENAKDFSVRTRLADNNVLLVVKASIDDTTSSNGTARLEWEAQLDNLPVRRPVRQSLGVGGSLGERGQLEELDKLVLKSGFRYQAKWSRERSEYKYHPSDNEEMNISIDKNAGYGYLAEFEMIAEDKSKSDELKSKIRNFMKDLGAEELMQDRLARMFDFYNKNWNDYYGRDKIFNIE